MPARRITKRKIKRKSPIRKMFILVGLVLVATTSLMWVFIPSRTSKDKQLIIAYGGSDSVGFVIIDRNTGGVTDFDLPISTRLTVSGGLGEWPAGSLWQLGANEKKGGALLSSTITRNFLIPVYTWSDSSVKDLLSGEPIRQFRALLTIKTNMSIKDKIELFLFALGVTEYDREKINLSNTQLLSKKMFKDGEEGYVATSFNLQKLMVRTSRPEIFNIDTKIALYDYTGRNGGDMVGGLIHAMGGKVANVFYYAKDEDIDCLIWSANEKQAYILSKTMGCEWIDKATSEGYSMEIKIGEKFINRF